MLKLTVLMNDLHRAEPFYPLLAFSPACKASRTDPVAKRSRREGHFRGGILEVSKERGSGRTPGFYPAVRRAEAFFRQAAGGLPTRRLKARLKAYSDS